jgi:hypothetical protein
LNVGSCGDTCNVIGMVIDAVLQCMGPFLPKEDLEAKERLILLLLGLDGAAAKWAACNGQPRNDPTKRWFFSGVVPTAGIVQTQDATQTQILLRAMPVGCQDFDGGQSPYSPCLGISCGGSGQAEY